MNTSEALALQSTQGPTTHGPSGVRKITRPKWQIFNADTGNKSIVRGRLLQTSELAFRIHSHRGQLQKRIAR